MERVLLAIRRRSPGAESLLHTLCHLASERDESLFVVGGLIRDVLLGSDDLRTVTLDIDLAIEGPAEPFIPALTDAAVDTPVVHQRFGTASATLADSARVDLARARIERYANPGALPSVKPASIDADLGRRDFSINAMALALTGRRAGVVLDPFEGLGDLKRRQVRTLHSDSFRDDPTRLIRAARYAARTGARIERRTASDARRDRHHLQALTPERFGDAWRLLLEERDLDSALGIARRLMIPQSRELRWTLKPAASRACQSAETFWAGVGLLEADSTVSDWLPRTVGMRRTERAALAGGVSLRQLRRRVANTRRPSRVANQLSAIPDPALEAAVRLWSGRSGTAVSAYLQRRSKVVSPVSPFELIELGVPHSPELGETIREIEALIWDGVLDPDDQSAVARLRERIRLSR